MTERRVAPRPLSPRRGRAPENARRPAIGASAAPRFADLPDDPTKRVPVSRPAATVSEIFHLLHDAGHAGHRGVLATITALTKPGARAIGAHMAVLEGGESAGSFSSGCVEQAIIAEALAALDEGASRSVRFGEGSRYIDIRLPCGGGMDVSFLVDPAGDVLAQAIDRLDTRQPVALRLDPAGHLALPHDPGATATGWNDGVFTVRHDPRLRLVLLGHGPEMLTSLKLARTFGAEVALYSPDDAIVAAGLAKGTMAVHLLSAADPPALEGDPWTAFLFLFHDHDWEPALIRQALETPAFWIGAMGSRATHAARRAALAAHGLAETAIARIHGPVGVIAGARDPMTLGLSALTEIVGAYHALG